jgi:hypothetical protein
MSTELLKKITIKTCGLDGDKLIRLAMPAEGKPAKTVPILRVFGLVTGAEDKLSEKGPYTEYSGMFEAVNLVSGETFKAGSAILAGPVQTFLKGKLQAAGDGGEAPFVAEIGVKYDPSAATKYVFTGSLLGEKETDKTDPLAAMRAIAMGDATKALPKK